MRIMQISLAECVFVLILWRQVIMKGGCQVESIYPSDSVTWMKNAIASLRQWDRSDFTVRRVTIAGLVLELFFDDAELAEQYCQTLFHTPSSAANATRLFIVTRPEQFGLAVPIPNLSACNEADYQGLLDDVGLLATYPHDPRIWRFIDLKVQVGVQISVSRRVLPPWDATAPLRHHLHWLLTSEGNRFSHSATLGRNGKGLVLFGPGGAGKSGTTLSGLAAGLNTVGDDYVALKLRHGAAAQPIYRVVKQDRKGLARIPHLATQTEALRTDWRGKIALDPSVYFPDAFVPQLAIGALVLPSIGQNLQPALRPAKPQEVMLALFTSNLHQFPNEIKAGMRFFGDLVRQVTCFHLDLSPDAARNGAFLRAFIDAEFDLAKLVEVSA
jgi:hypothetical protein